jgi:hypothetical protein
MEHIRKPADHSQAPAPRKQPPNSLTSRVDPANDGIDHLNILWHKAATRLGHKLSHFTKLSFTHPYLGYFVSMEGFWFYIRSGRVAEELRYMSGFAAKKNGRIYEQRWNDNFEEDIMAANYQKIIQVPGLAEEFVASELPFTHYYLFETASGGRTKVAARGDEWMSKGFEDIRKAMKEGRVPDCWINAEKRYVAEHANTPAVTAKPDAF